MLLKLLLVAHYRRVLGLSYVISWLLALATAVTLVYRGVRQIGPTAHALTW